MTYVGRMTRRDTVPGRAGCQVGQGDTRGQSLAHRCQHRTRVHWWWPVASGLGADPLDCPWGSGAEGTVNPHCGHPGPALECLGRDTMGQPAHRSPQSSQGRALSPLCVWEGYGMCMVSMGVQCVWGHGVYGEWHGW